MESERNLDLENRGTVNLRISPVALIYFGHFWKGASSRGGLYKGGAKIVAWQ